MNPARVGFAYSPDSSPAQRPPLLSVRVRNSRSSPVVLLPMSTFKTIEAKSHLLVCPGCGTCALTVALRCDVTDRNCMTVATCGHCQRQFDADALPTYDELHEWVVSRTRATPCPECGSDNRTLRSTCDRIERECFFVTACEDCGKVETASGHS